MTTKYSVSGNRTYLVLDGDQHIIPALERRNYVLNFDREQGRFYLKYADDFTNPKRVYGNTYTHADRILGTFRDRARNTGVLLQGEKGSGKTLLAREVCIRGQAMFPTIIIDQPYTGDEFNMTLRGIKEPCIIFIDEFEKVYHETDKQEALLTLLDGTLASNKLFLFTCNEASRVNNYLKNRPGRMFYKMDFDTLEESSIIQYINENMKKVEERPAFISRLCSFKKMTFDMLVAVIEEKNRYDETFDDILKIVNVSNQIYVDSYDIKINYRGHNIPKEMILNNVRRFNLAEEVSFTVLYQYYPKRGYALRESVVGMVDTLGSTALEDEIDPAKVKKLMEIRRNNLIEDAMDDAEDAMDADDHDVECIKAEKAQYLPTAEKVAIRFNWDNFNRSKSGKDNYVFDIEDYEVSFSPMEYTRYSYD